MKKIPYFAIGNNELEEKSDAGKTAKCPHCGKKHKIKFGKQLNNKTNKWEKSEMLGFVDCGEKSYLVSIDGKII